MRGLRAVAANLARDDQQRHVGEQVAKFSKWVTPNLHCWSHIRVAALAVRIGGNWIGRSITAVLDDSRTPTFPVVATDDVWAGERLLPISDLAALVSDISDGVIRAARSPNQKAIRTIAGKKPAHRQVSGVIRDPHEPHYARTPWDRFYRYELEWREDGNLGSHFAQPGMAYDWMEAARRKFLALSEGSLDAVAIRFGLAGDAHQLYWDRPAFVNLVAPIPLAFVSIEQSADRRQLQVELHRGARLQRRNVIVSMEQTEDLADRVQRVTAPGDKTVFRAPVAKRATFQLTYRGESIQRFTRTMRPPLRHSARLQALLAIEADSKLLERDLNQVTRVRNDRDQDAFERAVGHLLGLLGFSTFWWGPHAGALKVPKDELDLQAWSADDRLLLLVECTLQPSQDLKTVKLVRRAKRLSQAISSSVGTEPPEVEPVLVVGVPRAEVAKQLFAVGEDEVTVVTLDEIDQILAALKAGQSHEEIAQLLPGRVAAGLGALQRSRVWPDDVY